jgi:hypothetical protein
MTGLIAWWIVARASIPRLLLSAKVSKLPDTHRDSGWRYRVKVVNARRWPLPRRPVIDVNVVVTVQIRGLDPDTSNWHNYNVPVPNGGTIALMAANTIVRIRTHDIDLQDKPLLTACVARDDPDGLDLERLLALGTERKLRVMVTASNTYTHATTTKIAYYGSADIAIGRFTKQAGKAGLELIEQSEEASGEHEPSSEASPTDETA